MDVLLMYVSQFTTSNSLFQNKKYIAYFCKEYNFYKNIFTPINCQDYLVRG